jgi:hypothetical protein
MQMPEFGPRGREPPAQHTLGYKRSAMYAALEILSVMLAAVTMSLALALPGKLRLNKEQYLTVQTIYYPGFTLGGITEFGGVLLLSLC